MDPTPRTWSPCAAPHTSSSLACGDGPADQLERELSLGRRRVRRRRRRPCARAGGRAEVARRFGAGGGARFVRVMGHDRRRRIPCLSNCHRPRVRPGVASPHPIASCDLSGSRTDRTISRVGTVTAAEVVVDGRERFTAVSVYAAWESSPTHVYADALAHRDPVRPDESAGPRSCPAAWIIKTTVTEGYDVQ